MHGLYARMRCACCPLPDHISRIEAARDSGRGGAEAEECKDWGARREGLLQERQRTHSDTALEARRRSSRHEGQVQGSSALTQSSRYKAPQHGDKAHRHKGRVQGSSAKAGSEIFGCEVSDATARSPRAVFCRENPRIHLFSTAVSSRTINCFRRCMYSLDGDEDSKAVY